MSRMVAAQLVAVVLLVAAAAVEAGLNGHMVTAEWHAASTPYKNYFNPHIKMAPYYDPAWLNTQKDSASLVVGEGVEFGWGKNPEQFITLDIHDDGRIILEAHCDKSIPTCEFEDTHITVTSTAFLGASMSLSNKLSGNIALASLHSADGVVEVKIHSLKIVTDGQTKVQACSFEIFQPSYCTSGDCCDTSSGRPHKAGHVCRPAAHPCDISELCDGFSTACPKDVITTDAAHCQQPAGETKERSYLYADKHDLARKAGALPPSEAMGAAQDPEVIHPADIPLPVRQQRGFGLSLNYLGMAALVTVIVWVVMKDRLNANAKLAPGRGGLPAHVGRGGLRWE